MSGWLASCLAVLTFFVAVIFYVRSIDRYEHLRKRPSRKRPTLPPYVGIPTKWRREHTN